MEIVLPVLIGVLIGGGIYMLLARALIRMIIGLSMINYGVNLIILFAGGGFRQVSPPLLNVMGPYADPLPQALILTAIVIGFGSTALLLVVAIKAYQVTNTDHVQELAEAPDPVLPPIGGFADPEQPSVSPEAGSPGDMTSEDGEVDSAERRRRELEPANIDWSEE